MRPCGAWKAYSHDLQIQALCPLGSTERCATVGLRDRARLRKTRRRDRSRFWPIWPSGQPRCSCPRTDHPPSQPKVAVHGRRLDRHGRHDRRGRDVECDRGQYCGHVQQGQHPLCDVPTEHGPGHVPRHRHRSPRNGRGRHEQRHRHSGAGGVGVTESSRCDGAAGSNPAAQRHASGFE